MADPDDTNALIEALDSDSLTRVLDTLRSIETPTNEHLRLIALYGYSGRTERYAAALELTQRSVRPDLHNLILMHRTEAAIDRIDADPSLLASTDSAGWTPLHAACERGDCALVSWLVKQPGIDIDAVDRRGETALDHALHAGPWKPEPAHDAAEALGRAGARTDKPPATALFYAAKNNPLETVAELLAAGTDPNEAQPDGQTPLSTACLHSLSGECDVAIIEALLDHGAVLDVAAAIVTNDLDAVKALVQNEGDRAALTAGGVTSPLGFAIHTWRPTILEWLIAAGAEPSADDWRHIERIAGAKEMALDWLVELRRSSRR